MDRAEAVRRLSVYLPRYVEHSQQVHWAGPMPIINRALVLFGSTLWKEVDIHDVDLANIVWASDFGPFAGLLNFLEGGGFGNEYGFRQAERALVRAAHPRARLVATMVEPGWPPASGLYRPSEGKETAGPIGPWIILWEPDNPDWANVVDRLSRGDIPSTPDRHWLTAWGTEYPGTRDRDDEDPHLRLRREIYQELQSGTGWDTWTRLVLDVALEWHEAPSYIKRLLPRRDLYAGLERAIEELTDDEGIREVLAVDLDTAWEKFFFALERGN